MNKILRILTVSFPLSAVNRPVVVAVVVDSALAVEQKAVLACLYGEGTVCAEEELIAELWVRVRLEKPMMVLISLLLSSYY